MVKTGLHRLGRIRPKRSSEIAHSPWGVNFYVPRAGAFASSSASKLASGDVLEHLAERVAELGVKWARIDITWEQIEREKGRYDWTEADRVVDRLLAAGIEPYANIGRGNPLYLKDIGGYTQPATRHPEAYAAWMIWMLRRPSTPLARGSRPWPAAWPKCSSRPL